MDNFQTAGGASGTDAAPNQAVTETLKTAGGVESALETTAGSVEPLRADRNETTAPLAGAEARTAGGAEAAEPGGAEEIHRVQYADVQESPVGEPLGNIEYLKDVNLEAEVELGNTTLSVEQILKLGVGSIVELNQTVGEPVRLMINNNVYALGEVVVIGEKFGVRIGKLMHVGNGGKA